MMDNIREKLEILRHKLAGMIFAAVEPCADGECCESCKYFHSTACTDYLIADHMIANGVTVQEWISVEDELPKEQGFYRVYHKNSKSICDRFYYKDCPALFVNVRDDPITHWKPIEQPPKGA